MKTNTVLFALVVTLSPLALTAGTVTDTFTVAKKTIPHVQIVARMQHMVDSMRAKANGLTAKYEPPRWRKVSITKLTANDDGDQSILELRDRVKTKRDGSLIRAIEATKRLKDNSKSITPTLLVLRARIINGKFVYFDYKTSFNAGFTVLSESYLIERARKSRTAYIVVK
jgi:hypothetical protein